MPAHNASKRFDSGRSDDNKEQLIILSFWRFKELTKFLLRVLVGWFVSVSAPLIWIFYRPPTWFFVHLFVFHGRMQYFGMSVHLSNICLLILMSKTPVAHTQFPRYLNTIIWYIAMFWPKPKVFECGLKGLVFALIALKCSWKSCYAQ